MFEKNSTYKESYNKILRDLNNIGANFRSDNDKIKVLGLINQLKDIAYHIEPQ